MKVGDARRLKVALDDQAAISRTSADVLQKGSAPGIRHLDWRSVFHQRQETKNRSQCKVFFRETTGCLEVMVPGCPAMLGRRFSLMARRTLANEIEGPRGLIRRRTLEASGKHGRFKSMKLNVWAIIADDATPWGGTRTGCHHERCQVDSRTSASI